jgi:lysophospholipase L1-like esterase
VLRRLALIAAGVLVAALLVELALRIVDTVPEVANPLYSFHDSDPVLGWRGKADVRLRFRRPEFDTLVEHGPDGWRRPVPQPPAGAAHRVLVLGDSFTWGWGVGQGEVFTDRLQQRLPPSVAVINRGVNGFGTAQEYLLLQRELAEHRYDAVVLMFFYNDLADDVDSKNGRRPLFTLDGDALLPRNQPPRPLMSPLQRFFKDHSRAFQLLDFGLDQLTRRLEGEGSDSAAPPASTAVDYRTLPGAAVTMRLLAEMHRAATAHGAELVLVYIPQRSESEQPTAPDPQAHAVHEMVRAVAAREGLQLVDLTEPFRAGLQQGRALIYAVDDHWTPAGHELVADVLRASPPFAGLAGGGAAPSQGGGG